MEELTVVLVLLVVLAWVVLHYVTKWKTAATITTDDEHLLEELYQLARRLDERMDTVERLVASEHPDFKPARLHERPPDDDPLGSFDRRRLEKRGTRP